MAREACSHSALTIKTDSDSSGISDPDVDNSIQDNHAIDTHFDIAADNFGGVPSRPVYSLRDFAKISPKAVGRFTNKAIIDEDAGNELIAVSPPSSMADPEVTFTKKAFTDVAHNA